eukprot:Gb_03692 [translate_table: standard]
MGVMFRAVLEACQHLAPLPVFRFGVMKIINPGWVTAVTGCRRISSHTSAKGSLLYLTSVEALHVKTFIGGLLRVNLIRYIMRQMIYQVGECLSGGSDRSGVDSGARQMEWLYRACRRTNPFFAVGGLSSVHVGEATGVANLFTELTAICRSVISCRTRPHEIMSYRRKVVRIGGSCQRIHGGMRLSEPLTSGSVVTSMEDAQQLSSRMASYFITMEIGSREKNASPLWNWIATGSREQNGSSSLMGCCKLAVVTVGNPDRPVDGVNTIGMLLTSAKADTAASYPGILAEDKGRDPDYYCSLAYLGMRQRFRCGGVLDG